MRQSLNVMLILFLAITTQVGCQERNRQSFEGLKNMKTNEAERSKLPCSSISGEWLVYEIATDVTDKELGEGKIRGRSLPSVIVECKDNKITGKTLLYFDSRKDVAEYAAIRGTLNNEKIDFTVFRSEHCTVQYALTQIDENRLSGTFNMVGCDGPGQNSGRTILVRRKDD